MIRPTRLPVFHEVFCGTSLEGIFGTLFLGSETRPLRLPNSCVQGAETVSTNDIQLSIGVYTSVW